MRFPPLSLPPTVTAPIGNPGSIQHLLGDDLLQIIFRFHGSDTYLFLAPVCRQWEKVYLKTFQEPRTSCWNKHWGISMVAETFLQSTSEWHKYDFSALEKICRAAAARGDMPMIQWMFARTTAIQGSLFSLCKHAASHGHLRLLKWVRSNECSALGAVTNIVVLFSAAENGHLPIIKWAIAKGYPYPIGLCVAAARSGHLEILQWAKSNDYLCYIGRCLLEAASDHPETLQWIRLQQEE